MMMDIARTSKVNNNLLRKLSMLAGAVGIIFAAFHFGSDLGTKSYSKSGLLIAEVKRGDLEVKVFGTGVIVPKEVRFVAANVDGRVDNILVKPGAQVEKGQALVQLDNPELIRLAEEVRWEVAALKAENRAQQVQMETDIINQQARVRTVEIQLESAKLQLDAEAVLIAQGNGTVSMLDHKKTRLSVTQLENDLDVEKLRLTGMQRNHEAQSLASNARLERLLKSQQRAEQQVAFLTVRAREAGVIQDVPIELGQRLHIGSNLVKMADQSNLIAELQIAERKINEVAIGQSVVIDTRKSLIDAVVTRIDPAVVNGTVQVDVAFSQPLPGEARPDLKISGDILITTLEQTLYVRRPVIAQSNQRSVLYRLDAEQSFANKTIVEYGRGSSDQIQILQGLAAGDQVILTDHSSWEHIDSIGIN